jgi:hypothetical protein
VPLVLGLAVAAANEPVELARATVLLLPALALMLAWTLVALPAEVARPAAAASGAAVLVALVVLRALSLAPTYGVSPEDWRAAADYLTTHSTRGACVAFYPQDGRMPFDLYVRDLPGARRLRPVLPPLSWREVRPFVERYAAPRPAALARGCAKLWLVASHQGERTGTPASQANLRRYRRLLSGLARRYRHSSHRRFGYAAVVWVTRFWR